MRVPAQHLVGDATGDVIEAELAFFVGDLRVKYDVEQQVAQLFLQILGVVTLDRVEQFVRFIERIGGDRRAGLADIPGATVFGVA